MDEKVSSESPGAVSSVLNVLGLDSYSTQARLMPSLIVVMPVGVAIMALFPPKHWLESLATGILVNIGLTFAALFSELARDAGKRKQDQLWKDWGGAPSVRMLRHRDKSVSNETRLRYHAKLEKLLSLKMPTVEDEKASPSGADKIYKTCGDYLLEKTRDAKKFGLILKENTSYGFRRNLWGMKAGGIFLSAVGVSICASVAAYHFIQTKDVQPVPTIGAFLCATLLSLWIFRIKPDWIRMTADAYAKRLLAACEDLEPAAKPAAQIAETESGEVART